MSYDIKFHDIFLLENKNCPICNRIVMTKEDHIRNDDRIYGSDLCCNGCYEVFKYYNTFEHGHGVVFIFNVPFTIERDFTEAQKVKVIVDINNQLKYWKKDERYIMNLLEREI